MKALRLVSDVAGDSVWTNRKLKFIMATLVQKAAGKLISFKGEP